MLEIKPELELLLGMGFVRNKEYIDFYLNLTAWDLYIQGKVIGNRAYLVYNKDTDLLYCGD